MVDDVEVDIRDRLPHMTVMVDRRARRSHRSSRSGSGSERERRTSGSGRSTFLQPVRECLSGGMTPRENSGEAGRGSLADRNVVEDPVLLNASPPIMLKFDQQFPDQQFAAKGFGAEHGVESAEQLLGTLVQGGDHRPQHPSSSSRSGGPVHPQQHEASGASSSHLVVGGTTLGTTSVGGGASAAGAPTAGAPTVSGAPASSLGKAGMNIAGVNTAVGGNTSSMLTFKNPFKEASTVQVHLETDDTKIFALLLKRNKFNIGPLGILQIPYSFSP